MVNLTCLLFFLISVFLLLIVVSGFGDTTSKHINLEPSENQNYKLFFIFILLSASNLCSVFCYFIYFFLFWLSLFRKQMSLLMKPCSKLFSYVQHRFWCVPLISFKTLFAQLIQFISLLTHYYSQLYSHHLLEF